MVAGVVRRRGSVPVWCLWPGRSRSGYSPTGPVWLESLSTALARRGFTPGHDRGQVWVDVAVMLVAGGEAIADIDTLRHQSGLLGPVASPPTVWRTLDEATPAMLIRVEKARARGRRHVWGLLSQRCRRRRSPALISARWWCWMWTPPW